MPSRASAKRRRAPQAPAKRELPRVKPESLADFNESINFLIAGDSGVGKTPLAAQAPDAVILSTEKGSISAKRFGSTAKLLRCPTWDHVMAGLKWIDDNPGVFKWLIVDSLTKMQVLQIRWILERVHEENDTRDLDVPALADHQKWQNMFKRFVDRIVDMDINVIFITTLMHKEDAEGDDLVLPNIQGKDYAIANYVCEQMDGVYVLKAVTDKETGEPYWRLLTKFRAPYFAKDRYDAFGGSVVERPKMPEIIAAIEASGEYQAVQKPRKATSKSYEQPSPDLEDDWEEDEPDVDWDDEEDEPEPAPKPTRGRAKAKPPAKRASRSPAKSEPEEDESDDPDEDDTKTSRRNKVAAPASNRNRRKAKVEEPEPEDDEDDPDEDDWFDPDDTDDEEDLDFDDE